MGIGLLTAFRSPYSAAEHLHGTAGRARPTLPGEKEGVLPLHQAGQRCIGVRRRYHPWQFEWLWRLPRARRNRRPASCGCADRCAETDGATVGSHAFGQHQTCGKDPMPPSGTKSPLLTKARIHGAGKRRAGAPAKSRCPAITPGRPDWRRAPLFRTAGSVRTGRHSRPRRRAASNGGLASEASHRRPTHPAGAATGRACARFLPAPAAIDIAGPSHPPVGV